MYIGIPVEEWPRVVLSPSFAPCLAAIRESIVLAVLEVLLHHSRLQILGGPTEGQEVYPKFCVCVHNTALERTPLGSPQEGMYIGIPVEEWPRVVLSPSFAPCLAASG
jgi:hypothetical protein